MNVIHDLTFDVEFSELEQLGKQKISRELLKKSKSNFGFFFHFMLYQLMILFKDVYIIQHFRSTGAEIDTKM